MHFCRLVQMFIVHRSAETEIESCGEQKAKHRRKRQRLQDGPDLGSMNALYQTAGAHECITDRNADQSPDEAMGT